MESTNAISQEDDLLDLVFAVPANAIEIENKEIRSETKLSRRPDIEIIKPSEQIAPQLDERLQYEKSPEIDITHYQPEYEAILQNAHDGSDYICKSEVKYIEEDIDLSNIHKALETMDDDPYIMRTESEIDQINYMRDELMVEAQHDEPILEYSSDAKEENKNKDEKVNVARPRPEYDPEVHVITKKDEMIGTTAFGSLEPKIEYLIAKEISEAPGVQSLKPVFEMNRNFGVYGMKQFVDSNNSIYQPSITESEEQRPINDLLLIYDEQKGHDVESKPKSRNIIKTRSIDLTRKEYSQENLSKRFSTGTESLRVAAPNSDDKFQSIRVVKNVRQFIKLWGAPRESNSPHPLSPVLPDIANEEDYRKYYKLDKMPEYSQEFPTELLPSRRLSKNREYMPNIEDKQEEENSDQVSVLERRKIFEENVKKPTVARKKVSVGKKMGDEIPEHAHIDELVHDNSSYVNKEEDEAEELKSIPLSDRRKYFEEKFIANRAQY